MKRTVALNIRPSAQTIGEEGVTHINIDSGSTTFGQKLSMRYPRRFNHIVYGNFASVDNFYNFIGCDPSLRDDRIRSCNLNLARNLNTAAREERSYYVLNQRALVMDAQYASIMTDRELVKEIAASVNLKFDCYHTNENGYRIRHPYHSWFLDGMVEIRRAIIANERPDFDFLCLDDEDMFAEARPYLPNIATDPYEAHNARRAERRAARIAQQEAIASSEVRRRRRVMPKREQAATQPQAVQATAVATFSDLPAVGEPNRLMITDDTSTVYSWDEKQQCWVDRGQLDNFLKEAEAAADVLKEESIEEIPAVDTAEETAEQPQEPAGLETTDAGDWPA